MTSSSSNGSLSFTAGDLVVSISGDGDGSGTYTDNQASPAVLEELTTTGGVVGSLVLPQNPTLNASGTTESAFSSEYGSSSEGLLQLSADGQSLVLAGYGVNAAYYNGHTSQYGTAALAQTTSLSSATGVTPVARVVADIRYDGTVDTSTALLNVFNTNNPRSVATVNGSTFYVSGQGVKGDTTQGVFEASDGATAATAIDTSTDTRIAEIINNTLYVSRDSKQGPASNIGSYNVSSNGTAALPSSATTASVLPGISNSIVLTAAQENAINAADVGKVVYLSPEQFFFASPTVLYVADGGQPKQDGKTAGLADGGLQKWTLSSGGTWTLQYTLSAGLNLVGDGNTTGIAASSNGTAYTSTTSGLIGLAGTVTTVGGVSVATLYATNSTTTDTGQTFLYSITDTVSATAASSGESFTALMMAAPDTNIRGIAFAPSAAPCYATGTRLLTRRGEVAVEDLAVGDEALALLGQGSGAPGFAPVRWIGHRAVETRAHPRPELVWPVRIRADAFGPGRPHRDLVVSPGHALFVDGVLLQAARLVNGSSIVQERAERVTYWHVELERHDVLLAEGLPAESYLDVGNRDAFDDAPAMTLHPEFGPGALPGSCAPLVEDGPALERAKAALLARAHDLFGLRTTEEPALHLLADGRAVTPSLADGVHRFAVPAGTRTLRLASRRWVPAERLSGSTDTRTLGVCVRALRLDGVGLALDALPERRLARRRARRGRRGAALDRRRGDAAGRRAGGGGRGAGLRALRRRGRGGAGGGLKKASSFSEEKEAKRLHPKGHRT